MAQLIPSLTTLVAAFSDCFHPQVFQTFQALLAGWITCQVPRTISEVWLATGLAAKRHHDTAYAVFHSACWEWDDLGIVTATLILSHLVPGVEVEEPDGLQQLPRALPEGPLDGRRRDARVDDESDVLLRERVGGEVRTGQRPADGKD